MKIASILLNRCLIRSMSALRSSGMTLRLLTFYFVRKMSSLPQGINTVSFSNGTGLATR